MSTALDEAVLEDRPEVDLSVLAASARVECVEKVVFAFDVGDVGRARWVVRQPR